MWVPVAPPAMPVAITGCPSAFSARAMLTPLPPAIVRCSTVRWRRPRRKLGTESDLSIAALSVTVMIIPSTPSASAPLRHRMVPPRARLAYRTAPKRCLKVHRDAQPPSAHAAARSRSASARAAAAGSPPVARYASRCARGSDQTARAAGSKRRSEILDAPSLRAHAREQQHRVGHQLPRARQVLWRGGPNHRADVAESGLPHARLAQLVDQGARQALPRRCLPRPAPDPARRQRRGWRCAPAPALPRPRARAAVTKGSIASRPSNGLTDQVRVRPAIVPRACRDRRRARRA